jgi:hypothetical protein
MSYIPLNYTLEEVIEYVPEHGHLFGRLEIYKESLEESLAAEAREDNEIILAEIIKLITKTKSKKALVAAITEAFNNQ